MELDGNVHLLFSRNLCRIGMKKEWVQHKTGCYLFIIELLYVVKEFMMCRYDKQAVGDSALKDTGSWCNSSLSQVSDDLQRCSPDSTERFSTTEEGDESQGQVKQRAASLREAEQNAK